MSPGDEKPPESLVSPLFGDTVIARLGALVTFLSALVAVIQTILSITYQDAASAVYVHLSVLSLLILLSFAGFGLLYFDIRGVYKRLVDERDRNIGEYTLRKELERRLTEKERDNNYTISALNRRLAVQEDTDISIARIFNDLTSSHTKIAAFFLNGHSKGSDPVFRSEVIQSCNDMIGAIVDHTASIMKKLVSEKDVEVTIKILSEPNDADRRSEFNLWSYLTSHRSTTSAGGTRRGRFNMDTPYRVGQSSPLSEIFENPAAPEYFIANNINRTYPMWRSPNPHWSRFYNSCIVVPIRLQSVLVHSRIKGIKVNRDLFCGVLWVDSIEASFDEGRMLLILKQLTEYLCPILSLRTWMEDVSDKGG